MGPQFVSKMVHKPLAPITTWVQILLPYIIQLGKKKKRLLQGEMKNASKANNYS
jgi:hypothetical protein